MGALHPFSYIMSALNKSASKKPTKPEPKKAPAKKVTPKPALEKAPAKKVTQKPAPKKAPAKKVTPKPAPKKTPAKKVTQKPESKKAPAKKVMPKPESEPALVEMPRKKEKSGAIPSGHDSKNRHSSKSAANFKVSTAQLQAFFPDDITLKTAFKNLLALAKKNNGYVTDDDIITSLPAEGFEEQDTEKLFERLHSFGVDVVEEPVGGTASDMHGLTAEQLRDLSADMPGKLIENPMVQEKLRFYQKEF